MPEMQPNRQGPEDLPFGPRSEWGRALSLREAASWLQHGTRQADWPTADAPQGYLGPWSYTSSGHPGLALRWTHWK